jgi:hypothetical protein
MNFIVYVLPATYSMCNSIKAFAYYRTTIRIKMHEIERRRNPVSGKKKLRKFHDKLLNRLYIKGFSGITVIFSFL